MRLLRQLKRGLDDWAAEKLARMRAFETDALEMSLGIRAILWGGWLASPIGQGWVTEYERRTALFRYLLPVLPLVGWGLLAILLGAAQILALRLCLAWELRPQSPELVDGERDRQRGRFLLACRARRTLAGVSAAFWLWIFYSALAAPWTGPVMPFYLATCLSCFRVYFGQAPLPHTEAPEE